MNNNDKELGLLCRKNVSGRAPAPLCYCMRDGDDNGKLIFKIGKFGWLMTEWVFDQMAIGGCSAKINGVIVCPSHSTYHIIDYDVIKDTKDIVNYDDGAIWYFFTMSLDAMKTVPCVFRCWDAESSSYSLADDDLRAEICGTSRTIARFLLKKNKNGIWKLSVA